MIGARAAMEIGRAEAGARPGLRAGSPTGNATVLSEVVNGDRSAF